METEEKCVEKEEASIEEAERIVRNHMLGAAGAGLIPVPLVDLVALAGIQLNMLRRLSELYDVPFKENTGKHLIASLLGSFAPVRAARPLASLFKAVPVVGQGVGLLSMTIAGGASTYAVGRVFIQHFESGGTFLDFKSEKMKDGFSKMYKAGEQAAGKAKESVGKAAGKARETVGETAAKVKEGAGKAKEKAKKAAGKVTGKAKKAAEEAAEKVAESGETPAEEAGGGT